MEKWGIELPQKRVHSIFSRLSDTWKLLDGNSITIFGGTGFIGSWLTASLFMAITQGAKLKVNVLSRKGSKSMDEIHLRSRNRISFHAVDVMERIPSHFFDVDHIVVASTPTSSQHGSSRPESMVEGATRLISSMVGQVESNNLRLRNILHLSSGAVYNKYGIQKTPFTEVEDFSQTSPSSYIMAKIIIEKGLRQVAELDSKISYSNPRLFAFYGEGLPIDEHFAIGNFMRNVRDGLPIVVKGSPQTERSYLHVADLTTALLKLLAIPYSDPINLGSEQAWKMQTLAEFLADTFGAELIYEETTAQASHYVPNTANATSHLGVLETIDFQEGLVDWLRWLSLFS